MKMVKCLPELSIFTVFLKNRNFISKIRISKVTDYAALNAVFKGEQEKESIMSLRFGSPQACMVKSRKLQTSGEIGQRPCLFHSLIIGIEN